MLSYSAKWAIGHPEQGWNWAQGKEATTDETEKIQEQPRKYADEQLKKLSYNREIQK